MNTVTFADLMKVVNYNDNAAFVINDGTQEMYSSAKINDDTLDAFTDNAIECYTAEEMPRIAEIMADNFLPEFKPADGIYDEGYLYMQQAFRVGGINIYAAEKNGTKVYMLVFATDYDLFHKYAAQVDYYRRKGYAENSDLATVAPFYDFFGFFLYKMDAGNYALMLHDPEDGTDKYIREDPACEDTYDHDLAASIFYEDAMAYLVKNYGM